MEDTVQRSIKALGSNLALASILALFTLQAGWLSVTGRFPQAYDEAYHFGLIRLFAHHLDPFITVQTVDTYKFGPLAHNTPFLYHYLLSFVYRFIDLFTASPEVQVICLRFLNIGFAVAGLIIARKVLRLLGVSGALSNLGILVLALTPMMTVVSAQINYDNLLIPATTACVYVTILLVRGLDKGRFDTRLFLSLLALCLFSSLIKFAFLPVFAAVMGIIAWKLAVNRNRAGRFTVSARKSFHTMTVRIRLALLAACVLGGLLFGWFYMVNLFEYHNPVPSCTQVLGIQGCEHYPPWDYLYKTQLHYQADPSPYHLGPVHYAAWWLVSDTFQLYGTQIPVEGSLYTSDLYLLVVISLGTVALICTLVNFRKMVRENPALTVVLAVTLTYLVCLGARNYQDYLRIGLPSAVHGRYWLPVLPYIYGLLALGTHYALSGRAAGFRYAKALLTLTVVVTFVWFGGFRQYERYIVPAYGRLAPSNDFESHDAVTGR